MRVVKLDIPPDKSISHRAVMLASISEGTTRIKNLLLAGDIKRTIEAFRAMGVRIRLKAQGKRLKAEAFVHGVGMRGLKKPKHPLYLGNSGTTMRILPGILAGQDFSVVLKGDRSLSGRPMARIVEPLRKMGAEIKGRSSSTPGVRTPGVRTPGVEEVSAPLKIHGGRLKAIRYSSKIASAQVKSCILLAGLYADGVTSVSEPTKSRDHTERMLKSFGCRVKGEGCRVSVKGPAKLKSYGKIEIPGDLSSAAFFIVAACLLPDVKLVIKNVGLNRTRTGVLDVLKRMGAEISIKYQVSSIKSGELCGDVIVKSSALKGVTISARELVRAIDEIPIIMVAACFAKGRTVIKGIKELRVKETDRVKSMVTNLRKLGADIEVKGVRCRVNGRRPLHGARVFSFGDHRTAMSMLVAGLAVEGKISVGGLSCINKSFPGFLRQINNLI